MEEIVYKALLVGNATFPNDPHNLLPLKGPPNDLQHLEQALVHPFSGMHEPGNVKSLLDRTRGEITEKLEAFFAGAKPDDQLLFYYSGHGRLDANNNLYLCASDTRTNVLISTGISDEMINSMIRNSVSRRVVIVLDCCHSGRFKGLDLPRKLTGEGRFVLTSSRARQLSEDAKDENGPSAFTRHLVQALLSGEVDCDQDGYVSINEIYDYVLEHLQRETKQIPQRNFDKTVGEVALGRSAATRPEGTGTSPPGERPRLSVSETQIEVKHVQEGEALPEEIIDVFNEGGGRLNWTVESSADWIEVEKHKGYFKMRLNPHPGTNRGRIYVRDKGRGGSKTIRVFVQVEGRKKPKLQLSETEAHFGAVNMGAESPSRSIRLSNMGGGELNPTVAGAPGWVNVSLYGEVLQIALDTSTKGEFKGVVKLETDGGSAEIPVSASVGRGPILKVEPDRLDFRTTVGRRKSGRIKMSNTGGGKLNWNFKKSGTFFQVRRKRGEDALDLTLNDIAGNYRGSVLITSNGGEATVEVTAYIAEKEAPPPQPTEIQPGRWQIDINAFGLVGSTMILDLHPNGQLMGQQSVFGIQGNLQGQWMYDGASRLLTLNVTANVGGMFNTEMLQIQIVGREGGMLQGQDSALRQYILRRIG